MSQEKRQGRTIAANIVRVTLAVGIVVTLTATVVGISGASRLANAEVTAGQRAGMQAVEDRTEMQLSRATGIVENASNDVALATTPATREAALRASYADASGTVDELIVVDAGGTVLDEYPAHASSPATVPAGIARRISRVAGSFIVEEPTGGRPALWIARTAFLRKGGAVLVLGKVNTSFLDQVLTQAVAGPGAEAAIVVGPSGALESAAGQELDLASMSWSGNGTAGVVSVRARDGTPMRGVYDPIEGLTGLSWRVIIAQPTSAVARSAFTAIAPSVVVLVLGGFVAVGVAWVVSTQLADPLRSLEEAAYRAAEGSYVKPLKADRDDEIGRVADAFNAVAVRLNALHDLSQLLASSTHLDQVLDGILSAMGHIIGPGITAIYLLDDSRRLLKPVRARGAQLDVLPCLPAVGESWVVESLRAIEPRVLTGPPGRLRELLPGLAPDEAREAIAIPLVIGYEALGSIIYISEEERGFTEAETEMLRTFAAQAAVAVNNSRMFAEEGESREIAEALQGVAEDLVAPGNLEPALQSVLERLTGLFGARRVALAFVDRHSLGLPPSLDASREATLVSMAQRALALGDRSAPTTIPRGVDSDADALLDEHGAQELLVVPMGLGSGHGAVMLIIAGAAGIRARDVELADALADEIALALDSAYFYERAITRASNLETIFRISQALSSSLQFNIVLNRVLDVVQKIFSADAVWLITYDRSRRVLRTEMARGTVSSEILDMALKPGEDVPGYVFEAGQPATISEIPAGAEGVERIAYGLGLRAMLAVPLLARGRSIGVLSILSCEAGAFSDEDLSVLQTFAAQAALSIDTARLYSREHEVATLLQKSIAPDALPQLAEVETGSVYVPVGPDNEIGGDYYDLLRSPDGTIVFAIGDVVGKGVVAATKTSMIRYAVRALVAAGLHPARVLREVNRLVAESGDAGDIVTLYVARFDPVRREITWASGGHPPAFIKRAGTGEIETMAATGPLLGAIPEVLYEEDTIAVRPGDLCLLYTDGVTEARAGSEFFGEERVRSALDGTGTCDDIVQRLLAAVRLFAEGDLRDDVAIVAVRFTGALGDSLSTDATRG